jgi:hypothetical protein
MLPSCRALAEQNANSARAPQTPSPKPAAPRNSLHSVNRRPTTASSKILVLQAVGLLQGHVVVLVDDHVAIEVIDDDVARGNDLLVLDLGEGREHLGDVAPPLLAEGLVPLDRDADALLEGGLLVPAEVAQLRAVDGVAAIVERAVVRVLDPLVQLLLRLVRDLEVGQQFRAQRQVGDLVVRADVVDLPDRALVQDCVEGVGGVTGEQVAPGRGAVTV